MSPVRACRDVNATGGCFHSLLCCDLVFCFISRRRSGGADSGIGTAPQWRPTAHAVAETRRDRVSWHPAAEKEEAKDDAIQSGPTGPAPVSRRSFIAVFASVSAARVSSARCLTPDVMRVAHTEAHRPWARTETPRRLAGVKPPAWPQPTKAPRRRPKH